MVQMPGYSRKPDTIFEKDRETGLFLLSDKPSSASRACLGCRGSGRSDITGVEELAE